MSPQISPLAAGLFFIYIFISGFFLRFSTKPYNGLALNAHKLVALATGVYLGWALYHLHQAASLSPAALVKPMPAFVSYLHFTCPFLTALSTAALLYLLPR
jgi:hypothetical protein